ncbi:MAG: sterol desaturase family protein [Bacteroidota bacterium]|nr:sterol desaturase family protein [Bacteroidota bacterium]
MLLLVTISIAVFVLMEFWAAFVHRTVYHGMLWDIHRSHHRARRAGVFERNDIFVVIHAAAAMSVLFAGLQFNLPVLVAVGTGISVYGLLYALLHDGYIHGRLPLAWLGRWRLIRKLRDDHLYHHTGDVNAHFGLFFWNKTPSRIAERAAE